MQEIGLNFPTIAILVSIAALAVLSIRRMSRHGLCNCGDHCDGGCRGCTGCAAAESMNAAMEGGGPGKVSNVATLCASRCQSTCRIAGQATAAKPLAKTM